MLHFYWTVLLTAAGAIPNIKPGGVGQADELNKYIDPIHAQDLTNTKRVR